MHSQKQDVHGSLQYFNRPKLRKLAVPMDDYQAAAGKVSRDHFLLASGISRPLLEHGMAWRMNSAL